MRAVNTSSTTAAALRVSLVSAHYITYTQRLRLGTPKSTKDQLRIRSVAHKAFQVTRRDTIKRNQLNMGNIKRRVAHLGWGQNVQCGRPFACMTARNGTKTNGAQLLSSRADHPAQPPVPGRVARPVYAWQSDICDVTQRAPIRSA